MTNVVDGARNADDGLVTAASGRCVGDALDRLEVELRARNIDVFARIDHSAGAAAAALPLRPTQLLVFGNPKAGTPLMQSNQSVGIDLPLKVLGWQSADGRAWLTYSDPAWIARRHHLRADTGASVDALATLLGALVEVAGG